SRRRRIHRLRGDGPRAGHSHRLSGLRGHRTSTPRPLRPSLNASPQRKQGKILPLLALRAGGGSTEGRIMHRHHHSARALAETIVHANSYRQSHEEARLSPESPALTIAISRQVGAGGTSIATEVGNRIGWPVYDHALLERIAEQMHLRTQLLESVD